VEIHALYYAARLNLEVVSLRIASIYGPLYHSMHNPVSRMCHAAVDRAEPDVSDRPGKSVFADDQGDWTYAKHAARGIQMVHTAKTLHHRIYSIGSGQVTSHQQMCEAVQKAMPGARCAALKPSRTPKAPANPVEDLSRIKADVGYEPEYTIETGVAAYVEWLRSHPQ
jgi:UDP-glucose 4-epimerase